VKAMKSGAHDYFMKDRLERLVPAMEREIREASLRRKKKEAEEAYHSTRKQFELMVKYSPIGILILNKNGEINYFNPKLKEILGFPESEIDTVKKVINRVYQDNAIRKNAKKMWFDLINHPEKGIDIVAPPIRTKSNEKKYVRFIAAEIDLENIMVLAEDITKQHKAALALEESQKRLKQIIETVEDIIIELRQIDQQFEIVSVNRAFLKYTKLEVKNVVDKFLHDTFPKPDKWLEIINKAIEWKSTIKWEEDFSFPAGELSWEIYLSPLFDHNHRLLRIVVSANDITSRIKYEQQLLKSEERSRLIASMVSDCIWEWTIKTNNVWWNEGIKTLFGYDEKDISPTIHWIFHHIHPNDKDKIKKGLIGLMNEHKTHWNVDFQFKCKDGTYKHVNTKAIAVYEKEKLPRKVIGAMIDMTHRIKMEELRIQSLVEGADNERKTIASELHDDLAQNLMLSNLMLQESIEAAHDEKKNEKLHEVKDLISKVLSDTRKMSHSLVPRALEDFGIVAAIQNIIDNIKENTQVGISTYFNIESERFDPQFEINIYRIVQEALNNIIKHSKATKAFIQLIKSEKYLTLSIEDNGKGFDLNSIDPNKSIGLKNIENRVLYSNGKMEIETKPEKGTLIMVDFPIIKSK